MIILFNYFSFYDIPVDKVCRLVNAIDNNKTEFNSSPFISKKLRELLKIPEPSESIDELKQQAINMNNELKLQSENTNKQQSENINELKQQIQQMDNKLEQMNGEFRQQMEAMQKLLNDFIKNSSTNNDTKGQGDGKIDNNKKVGEGIDDKVNDSKIDDNKIGKEIDDKTE